MSVETVRSTVRQLARTAEEQVTNWFLTLEPTPEEVRDTLGEMVGVYADSAALVAADWYNSLDPKSTYSAFEDDDLADEKIVNVTDWVHAGPQLPESRIRVAANRLVFDAARRTILVNADREGVAVARHEEAECCNKCVARATTTSRHRKSRSDDVDQFFHPSCEGMFVPVRSELYSPPDHAKEWHSRVEQARAAGNVDPEDIAKWLSDH